MNVNIIETPADFQPVKSDGLFFVVSADTQSVFNFRYTFDVYVEGQRIFSGKSTPNPVGLGVIDVSKILNVYVNNSPIAYSADTAVFWHQTFPFSRPYSNQVLTYYIEVGEEHSDTQTGRIQQYSGIGNAIGNPSVPSLDYRVYLGTYPVNYNANIQDFNYDPFVLSGTPQENVSGLFMTNSPRQRDVTLNDYYTLSFTNYRINQSVYSEPYYGKWNFYDDDGLLITGYTFDNIWENGGGPRTSCFWTYPNPLPSGTTSSDFNILSVGVGPKNFPSIPTNTSYYTFQLFGVASSSQVTPTPTPTPSVTPTHTPSPTPSPAACNLYEITNNNGFTITETFNDCNGDPVSVTLTSGSSTNVCVSVAPLSQFTWVLLGTCPGCSCVSITFYLDDGRSRSLSYKDCNNQTVSLFLAPFGSVTVCSCTPYSWTADTSYFLITQNGPCSSPTPTPTPTPSSTPGPVFTNFARLRQCCDPNQFLDVIVDERVDYGQSVLINDVCYQLVEFVLTATTDATEAQVFSSCEECLQTYPCVDADAISPLKPDVEPNPVVPSWSNSGNCVSYSACSELFTFNLRCDESLQFGQLELMFRNRFGSYDYYRFWRGKSEALGIERQTYQQYNQTWGQNNVIKTTYSRGTTNWQTQITETHIINSGFIPQSDMVYLQELYTSDDVYEIKPDGTLFPINVVNEEFIIKNKGNKSLVNLELTYVYSNNIRMLGL
jgi:hypothetical protein